MQKIAIVHDHLLHIGGAEKVLFTLLKLFPQADIFTAFARKDLIQKYLPNNKVTISFYNTLPLVKDYSNWLKPLLLNYWEQLDLSQYDLVISSSHSYSSKSVITQGLHIAYIHTPPRYLYNEYNETQIINKEPYKTLLSPLMSWLRMQDYVSAQRPELLIANSINVQRRIQKYYRRDSPVIYPPVKSSEPALYKGKKEYYICVSRLVRQKGIDLAIKASNRLNIQLLIVGEGAQKKYLQSIAGPTIHFKGFITDEEISNLYRKAKAFIYCAIDEDFGMVPVEAMAHGVPVIAYNSGGIQETIIDSKTGVLFNAYTEASLIQAITKFTKMSISSTVCINQAKKFSEQIFIQQFKRLLRANRIA